MNAREGEMALVAGLSWVLQIIIHELCKRFPTPEESQPMGFRVPPIPPDAGLHFTDSTRARPRSEYVHIGPHMVHVSEEPARELIFKEAADLICRDGTFERWCEESNGAPWTRDGVTGGVTLWEWAEEVAKVLLTPVLLYPDTEWDGGRFRPAPPPAPPPRRSDPGVAVSYQPPRADFFPQPDWRTESRVGITPPEPWPRCPGPS